MVEYENIQEFLEKNETHYFPTEESRRKIARIEDLEEKTKEDISFNGTMLLLHAKTVFRIDLATSYTHKKPY